MTAPRFSLKWLLAMVAMVAVTAAALASASPAWVTAVFTALAALLLVALLVAVFGAGRNRSLAGGFVVGALFYLVLWHAVMSPNWLQLGESDLLTWPMVARLHELVARQEPPTMPTGTLPDGTVINFPVAVDYVPNPVRFRKVAHCLIACYVGIGSGLLARRLRANAATT
jgi:hypothetical protein